jgi:hypothetical protein
MIQAILAAIGFLPRVFDTIDGIEKAISSEKIAMIGAKTEQARIASQERISSLEARRAILVAEAPTQAGRLNAWMRAVAAIGPISIVLKLSLWDKVVGSFVGCNGHTLPGTCGAFMTDPIDPHIWYGVIAVFAFYLAADAYAGRA